MPKKGSNFYVPPEETGSSSPDSTIFGDNQQQQSSNRQKSHTNQQKSTVRAGWLQKWTNYMKGYRQRWFVIDALGILRYYRNPSEVDGGASRGSIILTEANIHRSQSDATHLVISSASSQPLHLKTSNEMERSEWLEALEFAKHRAIQKASALEDNENESELFLAKTNNLREMPLLDVEKMATSLQQLITNFDKELNGLTHYALGHLSPKDAKKLTDKEQSLKEVANTLVKTSDEMMAKCKREYQLLSRLAHSQNEKFAQLQKQYEILAKQHSELERDAFKSFKSASEKYGHNNIEGNNDRNRQSLSFDAGSIKSDGEEEEEEEELFHDATDNLEDQQSTLEHYSQSTQENGSSERSSSVREFSNRGEEKAICQNSRRPLAMTKGNLDLSKCNIQMPSQLAAYQENTTPTAMPSAGESRKRRDTIPPRPESHGLNLWSIMRNCIGKELSRFPLPVNFNEPLSMLQRITEDLEYSYLLDRAAEKSDICERLAYVGAFAISCYSATAKRTTKPFNPLLGETYEFDRRQDLGWRSLTEQVSHHPPAAAHHVDAVNWTLHQEFLVSSHFRGKYLSVVPTGFTHIDFKDGKAACTFQKITTTVHNIIVGKLWIDNHGEMTIVNHVGGERAFIKFHAYSYFSSSRPRKVEGLVVNKEGEARFYIGGYWDNYLNIAPVVGQRTESGISSKFFIQTAEPRRIWTVNQPLGSATMYNFTKLAMEMNEMDDQVAPTDSRRRPDQRLMEDGRWDEANKLKNQLEDKQRKARRQAEAETELAMSSNTKPTEYRARWFQKMQDANTGSIIHLILDEEYWKCKERQDWSRCPDIF